MTEEIGLARELAITHDAPPAHFDPRVVARAEAAVVAAGLRHRRIVSGAGHDAVHVARVAPTGMVFAPCLGGLSHHPAESVSRILRADLATAPAIEGPRGRRRSPSLFLARSS